MGSPFTLRSLRPGSGKAASFPPYQLMERDYLAEAQERFERVERIYHKGHKLAWDGKKVLADAIARNGGSISVPEHQREAIAEVFAIILWGELAAWIIAAELAERLDDVEAKMAASSQVFDEARHFYTMRDYLLALDIEVPRIDGFTHQILVDLLETDNLVYKLIGMQLLVENIAVVLFKHVAESGIEPVLCEIMPYFERDEARHVGLGVLYLPALLRDLGRWENVKLQAYQLRLNAFLIWGSVLQRPALDALGLDNNRMFHAGMQMQLDMFKQMGHFKETLPGLYEPSRQMDVFYRTMMDLFFPPLDHERPAWQRRMLGVLDRVARGGDRLMNALG